MTAERPIGAVLRAGLETPFDFDTVAFDVDGVLIDVTDSLRECIRATVNMVLVHNGANPPWTPSLEDIDALKLAGGFNDDIDTTVALVSIGLAGAEADVPSLAARISGGGGGLRTLRAIMHGLPRIDRRFASRIFDELYWGACEYERVFGQAAQHSPPELGLMCRERALAPGDLPAVFRRTNTKLALITGRTGRELQPALRALGWDASALCRVVTSDEVRKPDPSCLDAIVRDCGSVRLVYVGDGRDDWELVRRYRGERAEGPELRAILIGSVDATESFRQLGADATVRTTNEVWELLAWWRRPHHQDSS